MVLVYFQSGAQRNRRNFIEVFDESNVSQRPQHRGELTTCIFNGHVRIWRWESPSWGEESLARLLQMHTIGR